MKRIFSILSVLALCISASAQQATDQKTLLEPTISAEISPMFFLANGYRANLTLGYKHWDYNLTSYSHRVFDDVQEIAFTQSEGIDVENNTAVQAVATWLPSTQRKNFFIGGGISPEWYRLRDTITQASTNAKTTYALLTAGAQVFPFQEYFYLKLQVNVKYALTDTKAQTFEGHTYEIAKLTGIPHWSVGVRVPLADLSGKP